VDSGEPHDQATYNEYLCWLHRSMRIHIKAPYTDVPLADDSDSNAEEDEYDM